MYLPWLTNFYALVVSLASKHLSLFYKHTVVVSICVYDLFSFLKITPFSDSISSIRVHVWNYFQGCNQWKGMTWLNVNDHYSLNGNGWNLLMEIVVHNDQLKKPINNSYYFKKIYFSQIIPLLSKFYKPKFFLDVKFLEWTWKTFCWRHRTLDSVSELPKS